MRTNRFLSIIIGLIAVQVASGQSRAILSGRITDERTGNPLPNATIRVHDINRDAVANINGEYKTSFLPQGDYLVEVSHVGYASRVEMITISGVTARDFTLKAAVLEHEGVTVTGVSAATRLKQSPQPVTILKKTELFRKSSTNIINSLRHIPGVSALSTGPAISKPFIRGLGYNRIMVVHDGVRQEGQQWGDEHGIEVDDYSVQRVEVLKGPASLMYGSDGLAGVINIHSLQPVSEGTVSGNLLGEYQNHGRLRGYYGNLAGSKNGFVFNGYGSFKAAQDYRNKWDGYVFNSKFKNWSAGGLIGYAGAWGHSYIRATLFDQQLGMIEGERDDATGSFIKPVGGGAEEIVSSDDFKRADPLVPYQAVRHFKISGDHSINIKRSRLDLLIAHQRNQRREFGDPDNPAEPEAFFDLKTITYSARLHLPYKNNWRTSFGVSGMSQGNRNRAAEALIPDYDLFDAGVYVFTQFNRDPVSISGGLRFDNRHIRGREMTEGNDIKFAAISRNLSNFSGSAGISYQANDHLVLKFNLARGFRAPTLAELSSNGAHEGTNRFEIGNSNLRSETSWQADAGLDFSSDHIDLGAGVFYNSIRNFIYYRKVLNGAGGDSLVLDPDSGDELMVFRFDQQKADLYGVEFNMDLHPHPLDWLHFENTFSYTRALFNQAVDGSRNVPAIPAARFLSQLRGNFLPGGKVFRNFYASIESDYTFRQNKAFTGFNTETVTPGYWLLNASVGTDINSKGKTLMSVSINGNNLTDVSYQNHLNRLKYTAVNNLTGRRGVFDPGRNFTIKLNIPLSFKWG
jgi:iron complex outermembrane receptor protein